jgi:hypothetical protein
MKDWKENRSENEKRSQEKSAGITRDRRGDQKRAKESK